MLLMIDNPTKHFKMDYHTDVYGWLNAVVNRSDKWNRLEEKYQTIVFNFVNLAEGSEALNLIVKYNGVVQPNAYWYAKNRLRSFPRKYRYFENVASINLNEGQKMITFEILPYDRILSFAAGKRGGVQNNG